MGCGEKEKKKKEGTGILGYFKGRGLGGAFKSPPPTRLRINKIKVRRKKPESGP